MEVKRQLDVLDRQLANHEFIAGGDYSVADIAIWPWYGQLALDRSYKVRVSSYPSAIIATCSAGLASVAERPGVKRGRIVNKTTGDPSEQLRERHDASDFDLKTQDKLEAA